ncbi:MAG: undecaprenyl-diphosphate phosphatase [Candidatus Falkowbacteria bacterium]
MNLLHAIILGIVEGLSEFLPISSTAHLDFARQMLGILSNDFTKSFEIIIQLGAILAVAVIYWKKITSNLKISVPKLAVAFAPTAILGLIFYKIIKYYLLGNDWLMICMLVLGGVGLIIFEKWHAKKTAASTAPILDSISYKQAFLVGCAQSVAMVPGVSRSAATIIGGLALGISREQIVEFSFMLAIPTMAAATGLDLIKSAHDFSQQQYLLLAVGFISCFIVAIIIIKWFIGYIRHHNFIGFGWYRIIAGLALAAWIFLR